jgi:hypothetical protein
MLSAELDGTNQELFCVPRDSLGLASWGWSYNMSTHSQSTGARRSGAVHQHAAYWHQGFGLSTPPGVARNINLQDLSVFNNLSTLQDVSLRPQPCRRPDGGAHMLMSLLQHSLHNPAYTSMGNTCQPARVLLHGAGTGVCRDICGNSG